MANLDPDRLSAFIEGAKAVSSAKAAESERKAFPSAAAQADDRPVSFEEAAKMESPLTDADTPAPPFGFPPQSSTTPTFEEALSMQSEPRDNSSDLVERIRKEYARRFRGGLGAARVPLVGG